MPRHDARPELTPEQAAEARELRAAGWSLDRIASYFGIASSRFLAPYIDTRRIAPRGGANHRRAQLSRRLSEQSHEVAR